MQDDLTEDQNNLKQHGERITLDLDSCDIKENNYYEDVTGKGLAMIDVDAYKEEYIVQTVIIYFNERNDFTEKFVSQTFLLDIVTLETHVLNNEIILYVDTFDRNKYFFDFNPIQ
ncbi:MAG TPA: hypothetical protein VIJ92_03285 [Ginsengibacter sp.]